MGTSYAARGTLKLDDLPFRSEFLKGGVDPRGDEPLLMAVHKVDETGVPMEESLFDLSFVHAQVLNLKQDERVQYVVNSEDDGKAYFFGRMHKMYGITSFLIDSDLTQSQRNSLAEDGIIAGPTSSLWESIYEQYVRVSVCVRKRMVVAITWRGNKFWGYILGYNVSGTADNDNVLTISFNFFSLRDDLIGTLPFIDDRRISDMGFFGLLTREGVDMMNALRYPIAGVAVQTSKLKRRIEGRERVPGF